MLEHYPRDELFQIDEDLLLQFTLAVAQLDERPRVRVLPRRDRFDRFVSVLVYVPRERFDSAVRRAIGDYLAQAYGGSITSFRPFFPEGPLVATGARDLVAAGFRTVASVPKVRLIVALMAAQGFVRGCLNVLIVVGVFRLFGAGSGSVGYLTAALGVGGLIGASRALTLEGKRLAVPFGIALIFWGLPIALLGLWALARAAGSVSLARLA